MDKKFFKGFAIGCVISMVITLGVVTVTQNSYILDLKSLNRVNRATKVIEDMYYGEYDEEDIINGILSGTCFNLDKYSAYLTIEDYEEVTDPDQQFGGIGISSTYNKYTKVYKVAYCYDNTPASRVGLKRNDVIMAIDGYDVYDLDLDKVSELIRGEPGTTVELKIDRDGETLDFELEREYVVIPHAYEYLLSSEIGFIKITSFDGTVSDDFALALEAIRGVKALIIDLRDNSGGLVECYQDIMKQILPSCTLQTLVYKNGDRVDLLCESELDSVAYKFVVLVNNGTASCAEAMTQALADNAGAKIVGVETYGKGVAQEYFQIDKTSVLRLTVGYVESPSGVVWNEVGIKPDVKVEFEYLGFDFAESVLLNDNQVKAAYDLLVDELRGEFSDYVRPLSVEEDTVKVG